jgi:hypothetical protein
LGFFIRRILVQKKPMIYGYARVSADGRSVPAQVAALGKHGASKVLPQLDQSDTTRWTDRQGRRRSRRQPGRRSPAVGMRDLANELGPRHVDGTIDLARLRPCIVPEDFDHQRGVIGEDHAGLQHA